MNAGVLTPLERFSLVDDAWASVLAGTTSAAEFLALARLFAGETDLIVWRILLARLRDLTRLVSGDALACLRRIVGSLVSPALERLGWDPSEGEGPRVGQLRGVLIDALGTVAEDHETIARARETFNRAVQDARVVDADVALAALTIVAATGGDDDFERFVEQFRIDRTPQGQLRYLYALGAFPTEDLVMRAARFALTDEVRSQNGPFVFQRALRSREHGPFVWAFIRDHWDELRARFPTTLIGRMLEGISWLVDDESAADVPRFLSAHPVPEGERIIAQHLERQRVQRALAERERERLAAELRNTY